MSIKRQAPTDLNHENWDREDPAEQEEMGTFKTAPKEVLEKRIMRTAKRRSQVSSDEPQKSVFSGFGGFNKAQQSSFDFLANLTNGSKLNNIQTTTNNDPVVSSSVFTNKPLSTGPGTGIFSMSGSSGFATRPSTGKPPEGSMFVGSISSNTSPLHGKSPEGTLFGGSLSSNTSPVQGKSPEGSLFGGSLSSNTSPVQSIFTATKADSTVNDSTFKHKPLPVADSIPKPNINTDASTSQVSSTIFGAPPNSSPNKSLFSSTANNSTLFSTQAVSSTSTSSIHSATMTNPVGFGTVCTRIEPKKLTYFSKLRGLNESVSDWIKKHVMETPLCILSPIFQDYDKYLKEIQEEYNGGNSIKSNENKTETITPPETKSSPIVKNVNPSIFGTSASTNVGKSEAAQNNKNEGLPKTSSFNFGINTPTTTTAGKAYFGINPSTPSTASNIFSVNTSTTANASTPFSFGINKSGFGFNATSPKTDSAETAKDDDDEPPKVEFTPVVEENSVFDTKCKIFIKKDGNFVDKGVGTLYIKKIEESGKHQLLVRANTNLGSVLLNLVLSSSIPSQRMGKNNVMLVCIPTPDTKPPPTPILIRVKTAEEADELLSILDKYKA